MTRDGQTEQDYESKDTSEADSQSACQEYDAVDLSKCREHRREDSCLRFVRTREAKFQQ